MSVATNFAMLIGGASGPGGGIIGLLPIVVLLPVMYLVMIRPQQKRQKQWRQMLSDVKAGDRITTAGGLRGIVISVKDDTIVIRVAPDGVKLEVAKSSIASVTQESISGS